MAHWRIRLFIRPLAVTAFAAAVTVGALTGSAFADGERFDVTGTVLEVKGRRIILLTSDLIGKPQPITVDVSQLRGLQVTPNTPIQLTIVAREQDSYLATAREPVCQRRRLRRPRAIYGPPGFDPGRRRQRARGRRGAESTASHQ
jgi:hypothetical protein